MGNNSDKQNEIRGCGKNISVIPGGCPEIFDGVLCWPETPPGTTANSSCPPIGFMNVSQFAYKECWENGSWYINEQNNKWTNYTQCVDMESLVFFDHINNLYVIGYSVSLVALVISLWIFLSYRTLKCIRIRIHIQLFITFILNNIMWIVWYQIVIKDVKLTFMNPFWCQALHIVKEYSMVANYMWMFCEALHLHLALVVVFVREEITIKWFHAIGWGLTFIIVLIHSMVRVYVTRDTHSCWLNESTFATWFLTVPIVITLALSMLFLINILRVILTIMHPNSPNPAPIGIKRALRAALILTPLFGLQFILLPVVPDKDNPLYYTYVYTGVVIIPYQGLCCAVLFCFANHDVHQAIKRSFQRNLSRQSTRWSNYHTADSAAGVFMVNGNGQNGNTVPLLSLHRKSTTQMSVKSVRV
ncbi:calcitonin gene-related peptide type 1 receptor-like [Sitophilus oryzae]|uniref:Calcitonin gene-related peptide type 1 receptor-like n=1 Tax=Sitophilus oryzae TaxID=7048 RepID=A0A6J2XAF1_SITOR|nr:calcitonin gene-related peptide type 1 receptor-like [Sitophilus oryzae]